MNACPSPDELQLLLAGTLERSANRRLEEHLAACPQCQRRLEQLTAAPADCLPALAKLTGGWRTTIPGDDASTPRADPPPVNGIMAGPAAKLEPAAEPLLPGFTIIAELGRGGAGVVYQARQVSLNRWVALKIINVGTAGDRLARFRREAEIVAGLQHPNVVQIHEIGEHAGRLYLCMELVEGGALSQRIRGVPQEPRTAAALVEKLARTLEAVHARGVIHRDLKPANVLLAPSDRADAVRLGAESVVDAESEDVPSSLNRNANGAPAGGLPRTVTGTAQPAGPAVGQATNDPVGYEPKIGDFGLAKFLDEDSHLTRTRDILGTPSYMAPEQAQGGAEIGPAVDLYALGAILYELLTGRPPFRADRAMDTLVQVVFQEPVPPRRLQPSVPRDLETICLKCLSKSPAGRYASAAALAEDLRRFLAGRPIVAKPVGRLGQCRMWARRNPLAAGLCAALLLGLAVSLGLAAEAWLEARELFVLKQAADLHARQARKNERLANDRAYLSDLRLVQATWQENNVALVREILERQRPEATDGVDRRGFEWWYWWNQCHREERELALGLSGVSGFDLSPDGKLVAIASARDDVVVWDNPAGKPLHSLPGHGPGATRVQFGPGSELLACGMNDGAVKLWNPRAGSLVATLPGFAGRLTSLRFDPAGRRLAAGTRNGSLRVWNVADFTAVWTVPGRGMEATSIAFAPDGQVLASGHAGGGICLWNAISGKPLGELEGHPLQQGWAAPMALVFLPDSRLVSASVDEAIRIWDVGKVRQLLSISTRGYAFKKIAPHPNGRWLAAASTNKLVSLWDLPAAEPPSPPGSPAAVPLDCWKGHTGVLVGVGFCPDGRLLSCGTEGTLRTWSAPAKPVANNSPRVDTLRPTLGYRPDGTLVGAVATCLEIVLWEAGSGGPPVLKVQTPKEQGIAGEVALSDDGRRLAVSARDGSVHLLDASNGTTRMRVPVARGSLLGLCLSPDGSRLGCATRDGRIQVWTVAEPRKIFDLPAQTAPRAIVRFGPRGRLLASACAGDSAVKVWDAETGRRVATLQGHSNGVLGVAFSPDGRRIASVGYDYVLRFWDLADGQQVLALPLPEKSTPFPQSIAFSADGQHLALIMGSGQVTVWDAPRRGD